jgi:hypothetical protein
MDNSIVLHIYKSRKCCIKFSFLLLGGIMSIEFPVQFTTCFYINMSSCILLLIFIIKLLQLTPLFLAYIGFNNYLKNLILNELMWKTLWILHANDSYNS